MFIKYKILIVFICLLQNIVVLLYVRFRNCRICKILKRPAVEVTYRYMQFCFVSLHFMKTCRLITYVCEIFPICLYLVMIIPFRTVLHVHIYNMLLILKNLDK